MKIKKATETDKMIALGELGGCEWVINRYNNGYPIALLVDKKHYTPASWDDPNGLSCDNIEELKKEGKIEISYTVPDYLESYDSILKLYQKLGLKEKALVEMNLYRVIGEPHLFVSTPIQIADAILVATGKMTI